MDEGFSFGRRNESKVRGNTNEYRSPGKICRIFGRSRHGFTDERDAFQTGGFSGMSIRLF